MANTYKHLWRKIVSFENLLLAAKKAEKGKRFKDATARFNLNMEKEIFCIQRELTDKAYQPGGYATFVIHEPVKRMISAAPYRDRVVHHALCNVIEPLFERSFIYDCYANRKGKGTHRAVDRFQDFMQKYRYVLKCDIKKYFPSIDHAILFDLVTRRIADPDTLWLIRTIIDNSNPQEPVCDYFPGDHLFSPVNRKRGLPLGNLTSQFFGNIYLNGFDHFITDELGCGAYVRYVDDFAVFSDDKVYLRNLKSRMADYLEQLRLRLHLKKTRIFPVKNGCEFLGFYIFPERRKLKKANVRLFQGRLRKLQTAFREGEATIDDVRRSVQGWIAHASHANSYGLRTKLLSGYAFSRA